MNVICVDLDKEEYEKIRNKATKNELSLCDEVRKEIGLKPLWINLSHKYVVGV